MATRKKIDQYTNLLVKSLTLSAADTLTFDEIEIGLSLFDKVGILIQRIEYHPKAATLALMTASTDILSMALTTSNGLADLEATETAVIHKVSYRRQDAGTAANASFQLIPFVYDFSNLMGGGLLVTPRPFYIAGDSGGMASAATFDCRIFFSIVTLTADEYFELLETRHYFGQ